MHEQPLFFFGQHPVLFSRMAPLSQFVALLIDGDNIQLTEEQLVWVLQEAGSLGEVAVRRVYGNWAATAKSAWKELVLRYALKPCHHIHGALGKNATDIALVVDAMDLFYSGITHFCLVTSDSDYTPLIQRLRASGCQVLGIGRPAKNASLIPSCDRFLSLDQMSPAPAKETPTKQISIAANKKGKEASTKQAPAKKAVTQKKRTAPVATTPAPTKVTKPFDDPELTRAIEQAFDTITAGQQDAEPVLLVDVAKAMKELTPTLRPKDYGKTTMLFVIKERTDLFVFRQTERDGKPLDEMWRRDKNDVKDISTDSASS
jgi:uncharacterized protein (TIGR00288 family)